MTDDEIPATPDPAPEPVVEPETPTPVIEPTPKAKTAIVKKPPPLPKDSTALIEQARIKPRFNLNDAVSVIHLELYDEEDPIDEQTGATYAQYLDAVYDSMAIEGSMAADTFVAVAAIRQRARNWLEAHPDETRSDYEFVAKQNLRTIQHALTIVMRRFRISRKERAHLVGDEIVDDNDE